MYRQRTRYRPENTVLVIVGYLDNQMRGEREEGLDQKQVAVQNWQETLFYSKYSMAYLQCCILYTLQQSLTLIITIMMVSYTDILLTLSRTPYMTKWQLSR